MRAGPEAAQKLQQEQGAVEDFLEMTAAEETAVSVTGQPAPTGKAPAKAGAKGKDARAPKERRSAFVATFMAQTNPKTRKPYTQQDAERAANLAQRSGYRW